MLKIINSVKDIHLIVVVLNYSQCRFHSSIQYMLKYLCNVFPVNFSKHVAIVFTHYDHEYEMKKAKENDEEDPRILFKKSYIKEIMNLISLTTGEELFLGPPTFFLDAKFANKKGKKLKKDENTLHELAILINVAKDKESIKKIRDDVNINYKTSEIETEERTESKQEGDKIVTTITKYKRTKYIGYDGKITYSNWEKYGKPKVTEVEIKKLSPSALDYFKSIISGFKDGVEAGKNLIGGIGMLSRAVNDSSQSNNSEKKRNFLEESDKIISEKTEKESFENKSQTFFEQKEKYEKKSESLFKEPKIEFSNSNKVDLDDIARRVYRGAPSAARRSYMTSPSLRRASTVSGYGVSQMSVQPTCRYSPSKRPEVAWSENWCQWTPTICGLARAERTYAVSFSARSVWFSLRQQR